MIEEQKSGRWNWRLTVGLLVYVGIAVGGLSEEVPPVARLIAAVFAVLTGGLLARDLWRRIRSNRVPRQRSIASSTYAGLGRVMSRLDEQP
jgi:chromate transport protein ChrA